MSPGHSPSPITRSTPSTLAKSSSIFPTPECSASSANPAARCAGGTLRLTTPDIVEVCKLFLDANPQVKLEQFRPYWLEGNFSPEYWINSQFRAWGHQHLYSFDELSGCLTHAGFRTVTRCAPQETSSELPQLKSLENRYGPNAPQWLWCRTLIVEAVK